MDREYYLYVVSKWTCNALAAVNVDLAPCADGQDHTPVGVGVFLCVLVVLGTTAMVKFARSD